MRILLCLLLSLGAQEAKKEAEPAWPKLSPAKQKEFFGKLALLKRASPEKVAAVSQEILDLGKGCVPHLLGAYAKAETEARNRMLVLLDRLTEPGDVDVLLKEAESKTPEIRAYSLRRAALFAKPKHAAAFEKALADEDFENRFHAALGAARAGSQEGLPTLLSETNRRWEKQRALILSALAGIRGEAATKKLLSLLGAKEDEQALGALRLLGGAGDKSAVMQIAPFLDSSNNWFKEEAVNALRGIVDGSPPLENLSVFDLIEQAKRWKERLRS